MRMLVDFPAPFGPEKTEHLTFFNGEGNPVYGGDATK